METNHAFAFMFMCYWKWFLAIFIGNPNVFDEEKFLANSRSVK